MKTKQRHRLKENELAETIIAVREFVLSRSTQIGGFAVVVLLIAAAIFGITVMRQQTSARGEQLLAAAMVALNAPVIPPGSETTPPGQVPAAAQMGAEGSFPSEEAKLTAALPALQEAADAYPDSVPGITARYHLASALAALGRHEEAVEAFEDVTRRAGEDSLYGRMARLGKASTLTRAGQLDSAIASWNELASSDDEDLPKDAILLELAHAYVAKGSTEEARETFTRLINEHPTSPYTAEARTELASIES